MLVRQIETLRLKIKTDEKNHLTERARIVESKETEIRSKETEIDQLKESLANRDEKIHDLTRCSNQKDKIIQGKSLEIDDLKRMVEKTNEYARRIRMQVNLVCVCVIYNFFAVFPWCFHQRKSVIMEKAPTIRFSFPISGDMYFTER